MKMVRHDDEGMQLVFVLIAIVEKRLLEKLRGRCDLKEAPSLGRHSGDEIGSRLLRSKMHLGSINERPGAEAPFLWPGIQGPEGPCSLR
jgi:hypothetical protein